MNPIFDTFDYSVDMVRLATEVKPQRFQEVMGKFMDSASNQPFVEYREMKQIFAYRHNFYVKGSLTCDKEFEKYKEDFYGNEFSVEKNNEYGFWVGCEHNAKGFNAHSKDVVVEYNPNKCKNSELLKYVLDELFLYNSLTVVKKIDFAIDIYHNIKNVMFVRDSHCQYKLFDNCGDDMTHYMRKRGSHGHLKLYNKAREDNLKGIDKTRYEVTLKIDMDLRYMGLYMVDYGVFPNVRIRDINQQIVFPDSVDSEKISGVDLVLTDACIDVPSRLKELPYRKRKKIEVLMKNLYQEINFKECTNIQAVINEYFESINKIKKI